MFVDDLDDATDNAGFAEIPIEFLAEEVKNLEASIRVGADSQRLLDLLRGSDNLDACIRALSQAFGLNDRQAHMALYTPIVTLTEFGLADVRARYGNAVEQLRARQGSARQRGLTPTSSSNVRHCGSRIPAHAFPSTGEGLWSRPGGRTAPGTRMTGSG
jgi:hypothetical protein